MPAATAAGELTGCVNSAPMGVFSTLGLIWS